VEIWLLIGEIALLTDTVKQTIICVKCCANSFFVFRCIFIAFVSFLLVVFIFRYHTRWWDKAVYINRQVIRLRSWWTTQAVWRPEATDSVCYSVVSRRHLPSMLPGLSCVTSTSGLQVHVHVIDLSLSVSCLGFSLSVCLCFHSVNAILTLLCYILLRDDFSGPDRAISQVFMSPDNNFKVLYLWLRHLVFCLTLIDIVNFTFEGQDYRTKIVIIGVA